MVKFDNVESIKRFIKHNNETTRQVIKGMSRLFLVPRDQRSVWKDYPLEQERKLPGELHLASVLTREERLIWELGKMEGRREALVMLEVEATKRGRNMK